MESLCACRIVYLRCRWANPVKLVFFWYCKRNRLRRGKNAMTPSQIFSLRKYTHARISPVARLRVSGICVTGALNRETRVAGLPSVRRNDPGAGYEREMRRTGVYAGHTRRRDARIWTSLFYVWRKERVCVRGRRI
jgi:hypothetical protein